jgi:hypothetical protein
VDFDLQALVFSPHLVNLKMHSKHTLDIIAQVKRVAGRDKAVVDPQGVLNIFHPFEHTPICLIDKVMAGVTLNGPTKRTINIIIHLNRLV